MTLLSSRQLPFRCRPLLARPSPTSQIRAGAAFPCYSNLRVSFLFRSRPLLQVLASHLLCNVRIAPPIPSAAALPLQSTPFNSIPLLPCYAPPLRALPLHCSQLIASAATASATTQLPIAPSRVRSSADVLRKYRQTHQLSQAS